MIPKRVAAWAGRFGSTAWQKSRAVGHYKAAPGGCRTGQKGRGCGCAQPWLHL